MPGYSAAAAAPGPVRPHRPGEAAQVRTAVPASAVLLRPEEAAQMLCISRTAVYGLIGSGELRSLTIGRRRRIPRAALDDFVTRRLAEATSTDVPALGV